MPETEAIFDEGGMAPRPESGLYGLPLTREGRPCGAPAGQRPGGKPARSPRPGSCRGAGKAARRR